MAGADSVIASSGAANAYRNAGRGLTLCAMSLPVPNSLSPSKVSSFRSCPLAFRFSAIDRLPEIPTPWAVKGTLVHKALESLFWNAAPGKRSLAAGLESLDAAWHDSQDDPEVTGLNLDGAGADTMLREATKLIENYFSIEDPNEVTAIGVEITLEASVEGTRLRGIIDRRDLDEDGSLVVTDYKTGSAPRAGHEQARFEGVHFYALLCEEALGIRPTKVRLVYLKNPVVLTAEISEQSLRGLRKRTSAVWSAIQRACVTEDFRPKPSPLCPYCSFQAICPAFACTETGGSGEAGARGSGA